MATHNHNTTSNTDEVFRTFIGCRVKGLVREIAFEGHHADILVFDCGWGLVFNSNGSHWTITSEEVQRHIGRSQKELEDKKRELEDMLQLSGEMK